MLPCNPLTFILILLVKESDIMKKLMYLLLILLIFSGCVSITPSETARRGGGGRIEIIEGWELRDNERTTQGQIACIKPIGKSLPQVDFHTVVGLEQTGSDVTAGGFLAILKEAFVSQGATVVSEEDAVLGGLDAKRMYVTYGDKMSEITVTIHWERPFWLICTALASEFDTYRSDFESLAGKVSFYPLTEEQEQWIKQEGNPLGIIVSPLGKPEDLHHIVCGGFVEDWTKDGVIDGIAIAIDFLEEDQEFGKIIGWHNTRIVVHIKLTRKSTNEIVYDATHYGLDWQDFPIASDPPECSWIPIENIKGGFDPAKDMGQFILDVSVETEKQGTFTSRDESCPHPSTRM
jgi:hypothetical protein